MSMTRNCPRPGCTERVHWMKFACRADWFALPANIRIDINAAWQERLIAVGQSHFERVHAIREHLAACRRAVEWYRANTPAVTP